MAYFKVDGNGLIIRPPSEKGGPSRLAFDLAQLSVASTSVIDRRTDPQDDRRSLTLATLMRDNDGMRIPTNLDKHPEFKNQMDLDSNNYAGVQYDPKTGAIRTGRPEPPRRRQPSGRCSRRTRRTSPTSSAGVLVRGGSATRRVPPYADTQSTPGPQGRRATLARTSEVGDRTSSRPGRPSSALGNVFNNGTNNVNRAPRSTWPPASSSWSAPSRPRWCRCPRPRRLRPALRAALLGTYTPPATTQTGSTAPTPKPDSDGKVFVNGRSTTCERLGSSDRTARAARSSGRVRLLRPQRQRPGPGAAGGIYHLGTGNYMAGENSQIDAIRSAASASTCSSRTSRPRRAASGIGGFFNGWRQQLFGGNEQDEYGEASRQNSLRRCPHRGRPRRGASDLLGGAGEVFSAASPAASAARSNASPAAPRRTTTPSTRSSRAWAMVAWLDA